MKNTRYISIWTGGALVLGLTAAVIIGLTIWRLQKENNAPGQVGQVIATTNKVAMIEFGMKGNFNAKWLYDMPTNNIPKAHVICKITNLGRNRLRCPKVEYDKVGRPEAERYISILSLNDTETIWDGSLFEMITIKDFAFLSSHEGKTKVRITFYFDKDYSPSSPLILNMERDRAFL